MIRSPKFVLVLLALFSIPAVAGTWYLDPKATGSNNGTSWTDAWNSPSAINWNSINSGDTLYISGGSSSQTYTTPIVIGKSGVAGSPITIRIGQDSGHNGTAIFDQGGGTTSMINFGNRQYVTLDGQYNGERHIVVQNGNDNGDNPLIYGSGTNGNFLAGNKITYVEVKAGGSGIQMHYSGGAAPFELSKSYIHDIRCAAGLDMDGAQNQLSGDLYDTGALIHDNIIQVNNQGADNGNGPDAIQCTNGCSVYNNQISGATGTTRTSSCAPGGGSEHQDGVQIGGAYYKIYNNSFYCLANASVEATNWGGDAGHTRVWNNTFAECQQQRDSHAFDTWTGDGTLTDVLVYNNTFSDFTGFIGVRLDLGSSSVVVSNVVVRNNIFYNVGTPVNAANGTYTCGSGVIIDSNNINAGSSGGTSTICDGSSYSTTNVQTGAPVFVSYSQYGSGNDYHLQSSSNADIGHGVNLGAPYDKDKDGNPRGTSWDLGAYEYNHLAPPFITSVVVH